MNDVLLLEVFDDAIATYYYITRITINNGIPHLNNGIPHLKSPKEPNTEEPPSGKALMVDVENSPVRTFTLFPKHVTVTPRYGQLVLENTLKTRRVFGSSGSKENKICCIGKAEL